MTIRWLEDGNLGLVFGRDGEPRGDFLYLQTVGGKTYLTHYAAGGGFSLGSHATDDDARAYGVEYLKAIGDDLPAREVLEGFRWGYTAAAR